MAEVKPFHAVRYGDAAGPLEQLVAPPYDVISREQREELRAKSQYNVVHLTLPDDEAGAGRLWTDWRRDASLPESDPDLEAGGARLWQLSLDSTGIAEGFTDRQLLIADGHHRYETALAYAEGAGTPESAYVLAVLVSLEDPGLMIFPTHRV